jgi:hypothetical protein
MGAPAFTGCQVCRSRITTVLLILGCQPWITDVVHDTPSRLLQQMPALQQIPTVRIWLIVPMWNGISWSMWVSSSWVRSHLQHVQTLAFRLGLHYHQAFEV